MTRRPPLLSRLLSHLIIGPDADVLRGDLEESYHARVRGGGSTLRAGIVHTMDTVESVSRWWLFRSSGASRPRNERRGGLMRVSLSELRQIWRGLVRRPGYAGVVVVTLGLGIGATTTIYTVVDALLVRPLPYPDAERLVVVGTTAIQESVGAREGLQRVERMSNLNLQDVAARVRAFDEVAAIERNSWMVRPEGEAAEMVAVGTVTANFFGLLGAKPLIGRTLLPEDVADRQASHIVVSYDTWKTRLGGRTDVIGPDGGRGTVLSQFTIVGVLPPDFDQPAALVGSDVEFWTLLDPADRRYQDRGRLNVKGIARLAPGVTLEQARNEVSLAQSQVAREYPDGNRLADGSTLAVSVNSMRDETLGNAGRPVLLFLGAAALLLLLACMNAANLLMVRGLERTGDIVVRRALGAERWRLAGGLVLESVILALLGGLLGMVLAWLGVAMFHRFGPATLPRMDEIAINLRVSGACILLSIVIGASIGMIPALRTAGADLVLQMRASTRALTGRATRVRATLVAMQLALALVLGVAASLLIRSFLQVRAQDLGFRDTGLVTFSIPMKTERLWEDWDRVVAAVRAIPGVSGAAATTDLPFQTVAYNPRIVVADEASIGIDGSIPAYGVTPDFFDVAGIRLLQGRTFDRTDQPESQRVAIVNQSFARQHFRDRDPIGSRLRMGDRFDMGQRELEVVGVVDDVVQARVEDGISPAVYLPHTQMFGKLNVMVATSRDLASIAPDIRSAVARAGYGHLPILESGVLADRVAASRAAPQFQVLLMGSFAGVALLLSAIGLYGALAFTVRSRTRELGIRMAIGAAQSSIYRLVMWQGASVLITGLVIGLIGAVGVTRFLRGFLYNVDTIDPLAFAAACLVLGGAMLLATLRPASSAARIDPMISIRAEG